MMYHVKTGTTSIFMLLTKRIAAVGQLGAGGGICNTVERLLQIGIL